MPPRKTSEDYEQFREDVARVWRKVLTAVAVGIAIVVFVLLYNESKRDTCAEQGKDASGGILVSCEERPSYD